MSHSRLRVLAALARLVAGLLLPASAEAKVKPLSLQNLVADSTAIVLARVQSVEGSQDGTSVAMLHVTETWKGSPGPNVRVDVSQTWGCDVSAAAQGETAVFFLEAGESGGLVRIAFSGRGRLPVRVLHGERYADLVAYGVVVPDELRSVLAPGSDYLSSLNLSDLKRYVTKSQR